MRRLVRSLLLALSCVSLWASVTQASVAAQAATVSVGAGPLARVIVKLDPEQTPRPRAEAAVVERALGAARVAERLNGIARRQGLPLTVNRALGERVRLVTARGMRSDELAQRLAAEPGVAYAVPDRRMYRQAFPSDPLYTSGGVNGPAAGQWYLRPPDSLFVSAIDAQTAWDTSKGDGVVVAVLDTGVRFDHPDLGRVADGGKLLPGYDFIHDADAANDGDGRDADASDPGDFITQADIDDGVVESDCDKASSSWHGTQVSGILGALTDNATGMAGTGWDVRLLPVRVLGKCGGWVSDIALAMRWAAGIDIAEAPHNDNPARVINLSLGGVGACGKAYADAIADVRAKHVTVVVSAGNDEGHAVTAPANCAGVIAVGGLRHTGTKVGFSDLGPEVAIAAPGGNCANLTGPCLYPLLTTTDSGTTTPVGPAYTNGDEDITIGTSFSAPLVAGTAALVLALRPELEPDDVRAILQASARPFPTTGAPFGTPQCTAPAKSSSGQPIDQDECYCTTSTCGAGMLDASAAVQLAASGVLARIAQSPTAALAGQPVTLDASGSLIPSGHTIASVQWTIVDGGGIVSAFDAQAGDADADPSNNPSVSLTPSGGGSFIVSATVTDSSGTTATTRKTVSVTSSTGDGGGGGGALGLPWLLALAAAVVAARRATRD